MARELLFDGTEQCQAELRTEFTHDLRNAATMARYPEYGFKILRRFVDKSLGICSARPQSAGFALDRLA